TARRGKTALGRLHRHDSAQREHRDNECDAGVAELLMNAELLRGNQRGLCYQKNQPTGKNNAVKDKKRWEMEFGEEAVEKKGARESGENDCSGKNRNEKIEAPVAKTRG